MPLRIEQLSQALKTPKSLYVITGDEPLLVQETQDAIRNMFREQGVDEREVYQIQSRVNLDESLQSSDNLSLFAERKLIELRFEKTPDREQQKFLKALPDKFFDDQVWIISCARLDKKQLTSQWIKSLETIGDIIQVWPVKLEQLPNWIAQRASLNGLTMTEGACRLLAERCEGNLLAAHQDIQKLALSDTQQTITEEQLLTTIANNARYSIFELIDTALTGDGKKASHMLDQLRAEGVAAVPIVTLLFREWSNMLSMAEAVANGTSIADVLRQNRIWSTRSRAVTLGLQRVPKKVWHQLVARAGHLDKLAKGQAEGNLWDEILTSLLLMGGRPLWRPKLKRIMTSSV